MMNRVRRGWIALGSNLGDRDQWLMHGLDALAAVPGLHIAARTGPQETAPLGGLDQPSYRNAMVRVEWAGTAAALLAACHAIEEGAGRDRRGHWGSRTLDLDLVRFDGELCDRPDLTLPHPGLRDRAFWAEQLAELESDD
jgi:2-amino-4-hydroxy-6-hydroxymethyldihydropteridine diphosphokinase